MNDLPLFDNGREQCRARIEALKNSVDADGKAQASILITPKMACYGRFLVNYPPLAMVEDPLEAMGKVRPSAMVEDPLEAMGKARPSVIASASYINDARLDLSLPALA